MLGRRSAPHAFVNDTTKHPRNDPDGHKKASSANVNIAEIPCHEGIFVQRASDDRRSINVIGRR